MINAKILIVEDDAAMRLALNEKLASQGFNVIEAKNGAEGLEVALREHPDLILLDLLMPKMGGMDMLRHLRADLAWGQDTKVIILTNQSDNASVLEAMGLRTYDILLKSEWPLDEIV